MRNDKTLDDLHETFPHISQSLLRDTLSEKLGYKKFCVRCLPRMLTPQHRQDRVTAAREFLNRFAEEEEVFLDSIVTPDGTWMCHYTPESRRQSLQGGHVIFPSHQTVINDPFSRKVMTSVSWERKEVRLDDFMRKGLLLMHRLTAMP